VTGEAYVAAFLYDEATQTSQNAILVAGPESTTATRIAVPGFMYDLTFSADGDTLYGATFVDIGPGGDYIATVSALDTHTLGVRSIRIPDAPTKFVVGADGNGYAVISVFDPSNGGTRNSVVSFIPLDDGSLSV
jgi:hypothetical protein